MVAQVTGRGFGEADLAAVQAGVSAAQAAADAAQAELDGRLADAALSATFVRPGSVGDRLRKAAATAAVKDRSVLTSPPTITTGTSNLDATLTKAYRTSVVGMTPYRITGGTAQMGTGGYAPYVIAPVVTKPAGSGGNTPSKATHDTHHWRVEFMTDAPKVMLRYFTSTPTYMIRVNDRPVSATDLTFPSAGTTGYALIDFGTSEERKITIDFQYNPAFDGVYVGPTYSIWKPVSDTHVRVTHVGDSISTGTGGSKAGGVWSRVAGDEMGWTDVRQVGLGGTGFVASNGAVGNTFGSIQRVADVVATDPDLVLITASGNDDSASGLQAAALAAFQAYRAALPDVPIVVQGTYAASTGPNATRQATDAAVKAAFDSWADPNSWWVPNVADASGSWDFGTGWAGNRVTVNDMTTTSGSAIIGSATAAFTSGDVGRFVTGGNLQAGSKIVTYQSATSVVLDKTATATSSGQTLSVTYQRGDGNRDRHGADSSHPNDAGHVFAGRRFANAIRAAVLSAIP